MKSTLNRIKIPSLSRLIKEAAVILWIQLLVVSPNHAGFWKKAKPAKAEQPMVLNFTPKEILKDSFISYKAVGGFTGVKSYSVLISCKDGKISRLNSIHNPKRSRRRPTLRQRAKMDKQTYLALWENLQRQRIFNVKDAPQPKKDIADEFTFHFEARVSNITHKFKIYGMSRPEGARYQALLNLIDQSSNMASLWDIHGGRTSLVKR